MIESMILIGGLVLFSGTVTTDLHSKINAAQKTGTSETLNRGFYQDVKK